MNRRTLLAGVATTPLALAGCLTSCSAELLDSGALVASITAHGEGDLLVLLADDAHDDHEIAELRLFDGSREQVAAATVDAGRTDVPMEFDESETDIEDGRGELHVVGPDGAVLEGVGCSVGCS